MSTACHIFTEQVMELGAGSAGYKVASLGLPSADIDPTDPNTVFTFEDQKKVS